MNRPIHEPSLSFRLTLLLLALALGAAAVQAADLRLEATLIQGANDRPATVKYSLIPASLSAGLRLHYHWTNYYQITNLTVAIPLNETRDVNISDRCTLKIKNLGSSRVAIDCIGQGKQISRGTNTLPVIWGSDDTNNTAWFVSLQSADAKPPVPASPTAKK
jgi:hypothetical protein